MVYTVRSSSPFHLKGTKVTLVKTDPSFYVNGSRAASSSDFICYTAKGGVRAIHHESVNRALLSGHSNPVMDMHFSPRRPSLIATVASDEFAIVWELRNEAAHLQFREAIRLRSTSTVFNACCWHPHDERTFSVAHGNQVSLITLNAQLWAIQQTNQDSGIPVNEASAGAGLMKSEVTCIDLSTNLVVGGSADGTIMVWSASSMELVFEAHAGARLQTARLLSDNVLLTGTENNSVLKLWDLRQKIVTHTLRIQGELPHPRMFTTFCNGFLFIADMDHPVLHVTKIEDHMFGPVAQYMLDTPVLSVSSQSLDESHVEIMSVQENCIQYFGFDQTSYASASIVRPASVDLRSRKPDAKPNLDKQGSDLFTPAQLMTPRTSTVIAQQIPAAVPVTNGASSRTTSPVAAQPTQHFPDLESIISKHMVGLHQAITADLNARTEKDVQRQKSLLTVLSQSLGSISESMEESVTEALTNDVVVDSLVARLLPGLREAITTMVKEAVHEAVTDKQITAKVTKNLQAPIADAFRKQFKESLVPAFEAGCNSVVSQVNSQSVMQAMQQQQALLLERMARLEVLVSNQSQEEIDINQLIAQGDYEAAFVTALNLKDLNLLQFTCRMIDPNNVFKKHKSIVSQCVLLPLIQQLSVDLTHEPMVKLEWIRRAGMALEPHHVEIKEHVTQVMNDVLHNMERQRGLFGKGTDPVSANYEMCLSIVQQKIQS